MQKLFVTIRFTNHFANECIRAVLANGTMEVKLAAFGGLVAVLLPALRKCLPGLTDVILFIDQIANEIDEHVFQRPVFRTGLLG